MSEDNLCAVLRARLRDEDMMKVSDPDTAARFNKLGTTTKSSAPQPSDVVLNSSDRGRRSLRAGAA